MAVKTSTPTRPVAKKPTPSPQKQTTSRAPAPDRNNKTPARRDTTQVSQEARERSTVSPNGNRLAQSLTQSFTEAPQDTPSAVSRNEETLADKLDGTGHVSDVAEEITKNGDKAVQRYDPDNWFGKASKWFGRLGPALDVAEGAVNAYDHATDPNLTSEERIEEISGDIGGTAGALAGGWAGAKGGAAVGAFAGSFVGPVGTVVGGAVGGVVGGIVGSIFGSDLGEWIGENVGQEYNENTSQAAPEISDFGPMA